MVLEIFIFSFEVRAFRWGERENKKKEEGRREKEENQGLEFMFRTSLLFGTLIFVSMEPICMVLLVRKPS